MPVAIPDLADPAALTEANIAGAIGYKTPGVYVLGVLNPGQVMSVSYVGRSDDDLAAKLRRHLGNYPGFAYAIKTSPLEAYTVECALYHKLQPSRNSSHPLRPANETWLCPVCGR